MAVMNLTPWGKNYKAVVALFEEELGFPLPADCREFLKKSNGGSIQRQVFFVEDLEQDVMMDVFALKVNGE